MLILTYRHQKNTVATHNFLAGNPVPIPVPDRGPCRSLRDKKSRIWDFLRFYPPPPCYAPLENMGKPRNTTDYDITAML